MARAKNAISNEFAVRDDSALGQALNKGRLDAVRGRQNTGRDRYIAGSKYRALWDTIHGTGRSGALRERVSISHGPSGEPECKAIARDLFKQLEGRLSPNARYILRQFLGEGATGSEAVNTCLDGAEKAVWIAICLYLDELIHVMTEIGVHRFPAV